MPLTPGIRLGSFEIVASIGAGGMGEVYRARDSKLKRDVAIKILPEAFARDAERVSRFEREAEVLASLNHANIATVHDFEQSAGRHCLVMELSTARPWPIAFGGARSPLR
jgi:serine/threonine protein kinase